MSRKYGDGPAQYNSTPPSLSDGDTSALQLTAAGELMISGTITPAPGGATAANQVIEISYLTSIDTKLTTTNSSLSSIDGKLTLQATAALQTTGNASLSSIDTKLTSQATAANQATGNASLSSIDGKLTTTNASLSSIDTKLSSQATAANQVTGNASLSSIDTKLSSQATAANQATEIASLSSIDGKLTTANTSLSSIDTKTPSLGQATMANSTPVVIASDQSSISVTLAAALPAGSNVIGAVTQSGTWSTRITDSAGNTISSSSSRLLVDGSGVTQPISAASLPLPTGASTAAKQPALGTAGTPSADVITVQGIASMTALKVDGSAVTQPVSGTVTANQGGTWNINNISGTISLPTGASTAANQTTANSSLSSIDGKITTDNNQIMVQDTINTSAQYQAVSVTTTPVEAKGAGSRLTNRKMVVITPTNGTVYWASNNSVSSTTGTPIFTNQMVSLSFTDNVQVWLVTASGTVDVRVLEGS